MVFERSRQQVRLNQSHPTEAWSHHVPFSLWQRRTVAVLGENRCVMSWPYHLPMATFHESIVASVHECFFPDIPVRTERRRHHLGRFAILQRHFFRNCYLFHFLHRTMLSRQVDFPNWRQAYRYRLEVHSTSEVSLHDFQHHIVQDWNALWKPRLKNHKRYRWLRCT